MKLEEIKIQYPIMKRYLIPPFNWFDYTQFGIDTGERFTNPLGIEEIVNYSLDKLKSLGKDVQKEWSDT